VISRLINLFKKTDLDEQRAFQRRVFMILCETQPERFYALSSDPLSLELEGQKLCLTNIRANFLLTSQTDSDLYKVVTEHFQSVLRAGDVEERTQLGWDLAKPDLMPQLMPAAFRENLELISLPFAGEIVIGFVVDSESTYSYVSRQDIERWNVSETEVNRTAIQNLRDRSKGLDATGVPGPNGLFVVSTMDGFDAVRIISEDLRAACEETIGTSFYFGVPNRDFLICWSNNEDSGFQASMRAQIAKDFEERPYPLSSLVFEVTPDGDFRPVPPGPVDARASIAERN
jgi:uncharacterized protein YtpQ (UPF0354 family)